MDYIDADILEKNDAWSNIPVVGVDFDDDVVEVGWEDVISTVNSGQEASEDDEDEDEDGY